MQRGPMTVHACAHAFLRQLKNAAQGLSPVPDLLFEGVEQVLIPCAEGSAHAGAIVTALAREALVGPRVMAAAVDRHEPCRNAAHPRGEVKESDKRREHEHGTSWRPSFVSEHQWSTSRRHWQGKHR